MANKEFTAEGVPTDGTQLTTGNLGSASGDVIAPIKASGASITGTANSSEVIYGTASAKLVAASGQYAYLSWPENNLSATGIRAYFRLSATATNYTIMGISNGSATIAKVILLSNGHLYVQDSTGSVTYQTPSALTLPGIYAVDLAVQPGTSTTNGRIQFAVYESDGDFVAGMTTPFTNDAANTGTATISSLNVGKIESTAVDVTMIVDNIKRTDSYTLVGAQASTAYVAAISPGGQTGLKAGQLRTLSSSGSLGSPSLFQWTQTAGPSVGLSDPTLSSVSYVVPAVKTDSSVSFQLKVGDSSSLSDPVSVTDTISKHTIWRMLNGTLDASTFRKISLPATTVTATNITTTSVTLNWTAVSGADSYKVGRDGSDSNGNGPYETTDPSTARSRVFINLIPNTTYTIYCTPQPGGTKKSITITTAAQASTESWNWSDSNVPWDFANASEMTNNWPSDTNYVDLQTGSGTFYDRLKATVDAAGKRVVVRLPAGTFHFTSFRMIGSSGSPTYAFGFWHSNLQGFLGQGADQTIIQMDQNSVSQDQLNDMMTMEAGPEGKPNQMGFMRLDGTAAEPVLVAGVTFRGTDQPMLTNGTDSVKSYGGVFPSSAPYCGIVLYSGSPAIINHTRFQAAGRALLGLPPFEHADLTSQYSSSVKISNCEFDGRLAAEVDSNQPRRCGPIMANNETFHQMNNCWLHHSLFTRYAANDQNRDTYGTYELNQCKIDHINPSDAGWESCAATINVTDCIIGVDVPQEAATDPGYTYHLSLTPVGSRSNPQGGRLNVTRGRFTNAKYPSMDGFMTLRAIASMHWVTDGYDTTMKIYGNNGQRLTPYVSSAWPVSASTISSAGLSPNTHFIVRTS